MTPSPHAILGTAAHAALYAPSVLNTQPWSWHLYADYLELRADRGRQARVVDPHGRLLLLSCGIALNHACVSVAAQGYVPQVERLVFGSEDNPLARVRLGPSRCVDITDEAMSEAIPRRRTDRRPFGDDAVPEAAVDAMRAAARAAGADLYHVARDQMPMLAVAVGQANASEMTNPDYRIELMRWSNRPQWSGDGVPAEVTVRRGPRRVPMRELSVGPRSGMTVAPGGDLGAAYFVLFGERDDHTDWLRAGEAASAVMLTATALDLSVSAISDVIEVEHPRDLVRGLLRRPGVAYLVLRCGWPPSTGDLPAVPRRQPEDVIVDLCPFDGPEPAGSVS